MTEPNLSVDPAKLTKAGLVLDPVSVKIHGAINRFLTTQSEVGPEPWGTDRTGQAVGDAYRQSKPEQVVESGQNFRDGVDDVETRVVLMSIDYSTTEDINSQ